MKLILETTNGHILERINVPNQYNVDSELRNGAYFQEELTNPAIKYFYTNGLLFIDVQSKLLQNTLCKITSEDEFVALIFFLKENYGVSTISKEAHSCCSIGSTGHNVEVIHNGKLEFVFNKAKQVDLFMLLLSKEFFLRLMPMTHKKLKGLTHALENKKHMMLFKEYVPLSQEIQQIISNVRRCSRKGSFFRLCLEIKIAELLMLQLEQYQLQQTNHLSRPAFHDADIKKIEQARNILDNNYSEPPTIKSLALKIGMNETKLKAYFKKMYGDTIHKYVISLRMKKAHDLLTKQNLLLKEVALKVGYQKTSNFTNVFIKYYGVHPKKSRNLIQKHN